VLAAVAFRDAPLLYGESAIPQDALASKNKGPDHFDIDCVVIWSDTVDATSSDGLGVDGLKYSLRSVMQHASFVRRIHLVTPDEQALPAWLVKDSHKLHIVRHSQIFERPEAELPTLNPMAIEANIHKVPGLTSHFFLLGPGMYMTSHMAATDVFTREGLAIQYFQDTTDQYRGIAAQSTGTRRVLEQYVAGRVDNAGAKAAELLSFLPHFRAMNREVMEQSERDFLEDVTTTTHHKQMQPVDISLPQLARVASLADHRAALAHWNQFEFALVDSAEPLPSLEKSFAEARTTRPILLVVDTQRGVSAEVRTRMLANLESLLPVASDLEIS